MPLHLSPLWYRWTPEQIDAKVKECNAYREQMMADLRAAGIDFTVKEDDFVCQLTIYAIRPDKREQYIQIRAFGDKPIVDDGRIVYWSQDAMETIKRILNR